MEYIQHRLRFFNDGVQTYTRRKYARLALDKYIWSTKAMDTLTSKIVQNKSAMVLIGAANMNPNSPIKKYKRCPGMRRLVASMKKRGNCTCVFVDEYNTSQKCARCFEQFPEGTRAHRMKMCRRCDPIDEALPANVVSSYVSKRKLRRRKQEQQVLQNHQQHAVMVQKKTRFIKNTELLPAAEGDAAVGQTIWHRDITAAKLILYKGKQVNCILYLR